MFQESFLFNTDQGNIRLPIDRKKLQKLSSHKIHLGTSSWKYRAWEGMVYRGGYHSEAQFQAQALQEYSDIFSAVGVDFTFYDWPNRSTLAHIDSQTPDHFRFCFKVTEQLTLQQFTNLPRYGKFAGKESPYFLDPIAFRDKFLEPLRTIKHKVGALFFEFGHLEDTQLPDFARFFKKVSKEFPIGIEVRNPHFVSPAWYKFLAGLGISPIFNSWTKMPRVGVQWKYYLESGADKSCSNPIMIRGLLKPGRVYKDAVKMFMPYGSLGQIVPEFRADMSTIIRWSKENKRSAFVMVNNRLEGCSPETIGAIVKSLPSEITL